MKKAIITGVTGQDGSYLAELLIKQGYKVYGGIRRNSDFTSKRIDHIFHHEKFNPFNFELTDVLSLTNIVSEIKPDLFFNLAALSHVGVSFDLPYNTTLNDGLAVVAMIDSLKSHAPHCKYYQAGTSELFGGNPKDSPQDMTTKFDPKSPYAVAKLLAHYTVKNAYNRGDLLAYNGVLFNHESPRRGRTFVTKKITEYVSRYANSGYQSSLKLGNLHALRDWGYAPQYVELMYKHIVQESAPQEFMVGTQSCSTVKTFVDKSFEFIGEKITYSGTDLDLKGYDSKGNCVVEIDAKYFRPLEVSELKAGSVGNVLERTDAIDLDDIVQRMMWYDLRYEEYGNPEFTDRFSYFW